MTPAIGDWLYASCSAEFYGEIVDVGEDYNGQSTIAIRIEHPNDLIGCESVDMGETPLPGQWENPMTTLELPEGAKAVLRHVQWRGMRQYEDLIECNTPGSGCYRCTKLFLLVLAADYPNHWLNK